MKENVMFMKENVMFIVYVLKVKCYVNFFLL